MRFTFVSRQRNPNRVSLTTDLNIFCRHVCCKPNQPKHFYQNAPPILNADYYESVNSSGFIVHITKKLAIILSTPNIDTKTAVYLTLLLPA